MLSSLPLEKARVWRMCEGSARAAWARLAMATQTMMGPRGSNGTTGVRNGRNGRFQAIGTQMEWGETSGIGFSGGFGQVRQNCIHVHYDHGG